MPGVDGLAFVSYSVRDLARVVAFNREVLGLRVGETFGDEVVEFDVDGATFAIDTNAIDAPGTQRSAAFEARDVAETRRTLAEKDVRVSDVFDHGVCFAFVAIDPDGDRVMLHERKAR